MSTPHRLLRATAAIVPPPHRADFLRAWHAELAHAQLAHAQLAHAQLCPARHPRRPPSLASGIVCDALWLRTEHHRRHLYGTAALGLAILAALLTPAALLAVLLHGGLQPLALRIHDQLACFLVAAAIVLSVTFAVAPSRPVPHPSTPGPLFCRLRRNLFLAARSALALALTYLLALDLLAPLHLLFPITADLFQILTFTLTSLCGLRWLLQDHHLRCKHCLRTLTPPTRVGRPSHNLLEWNGTHLACPHGHGALTVPELETSWSPTPQWITT